MRGLLSEAWPESQWEKGRDPDASGPGINFRAHGLNSPGQKMEPQEGQFDFAWLDRALKVLSAHGIRAVLEPPPPRRPPGCMKVS